MSARGTIAAVGSAVKGFNNGDRVAGCHAMDILRVTYAEYTVCPSQTVFRLPDSMRYEEAATMPLAIFTAAVGLYRNLAIPAPWDRSDEKAASTGKVALVVNAASSAVDSFAIKLAKLNPRIGPIIATTGASADYVRSLDVDAVVDHRSPSIVEDIKNAADGAPIKYVTTIPKPVAGGKEENNRRVVNLLWVPVPVGMYTNHTGHPVRVNNSNAFVVYDSSSPESTCSTRSTL